MKIKQYKIVLWCVLLFIVSALVGCTPPSPPSPATRYYNNTITDSYGNAKLTVADKMLNIHVTDENGMPVPGVTVEAYSLDGKFLVIAGSEDYYPSIRILSDADFLPSSSKYEPQIAIATATVAMTVIAATSIALTVYDYISHPNEFPLQVYDVITKSGRVKAICVEIDANDILALVSLISDMKTLFDAAQVIGAPAKIRGVTAINLGFTWKNVKIKGAEFVVEQFKRLADILDSDIVHWCHYIYNAGDKEVELPFFTVNVKRLYAESEHKLYAISPLPKGVDVEIGEIVTPAGEKPSITDIAWDNNKGLLYACSFSQLYIVDPSTAQAYPLGTNLGVDGINALACDPLGRLFAAGLDGNFYEIDPVQWKAIKIGAYGSDWYSSGDIVFCNDFTVFATVRGWASDILVRVDPMTGRASSVGAIGYPEVFGLFLVDEQLYGVTSSGELISINKTTGKGTLVRNIRFGAWGAQSVKRE